MYQDLSTPYYRQVEYAINDSPIRLKGNWKQTSSNFFSSSGVQKKDLSAASRALLAGVRLRVQTKHDNCSWVIYW